jgi:hypothetical protein
VTTERIEELKTDRLALESLFAYPRAVMQRHVCGYGNASRDETNAALRQINALYRSIAFIDGRIRREGTRALDAAAPTFSDQRRWTDDHCGCHACVDVRSRGTTTKHGVASWMILCPTCRNKRCPHASNHDLACTGSNEPGQPGSVYTACNKPCTTGSPGLGCSVVVGHEGGCRP